MRNATAIKRLGTVYDSLATVMDERMRRQWAAAEARAYGWGGIRAVGKATGMSANTITKGLAELEARETEPRAAIATRIRHPGAGRKRVTEDDPELQGAL